MRHDFYRPGGFHYLKGGVDANGALVAWRGHFVSYGEGERFAASANIPATEFPAGFVPNFAIHVSNQPLGVPTGALRAPRSNAVAWVYQSFIDELAHAAGKDPLQFRLDLLAKPRSDAAAPGGKAAGRRLQRRADARRAARWSARCRAGASDSCPRARRSASRAITATAATSPKSPRSPSAPTRRVKVNKVWVAGDVGSQIINPSSAENQVQGAVIDGLAELMAQEITIENGRTVQSNFNQFPLIRHTQAPPQIEVKFGLDEQPADGSWRAGAAADSARGVQRDLQRSLASAFARCR